MSWGWLSTICFSLCGAPQAYLSYRNKHSDGVSWGLLILWTLGEIFGLIYMVPKADFPIIVNYLVNLLWLSVILRYKFV